MQPKFGLNLWLSIMWCVVCIICSLHLSNSVSLWISRTTRSFPFLFYPLLHFPDCSATLPFIPRNFPLSLFVSTSIYWSISPSPAALHPSCILTHHSHSVSFDCICVTNSSSSPVISHHNMFTSFAYHLPSVPTHHIEMEAEKPKNKTAVTGDTEKVSGPGPWGIYQHEQQMLTLGARD